MIQRKVDQIFKELPNVFGTADQSFIVGYDDDSTCHDRTLCRVHQICKKM